MKKFVFVVACAIGFVSTPVLAQDSGVYASLGYENFEAGSFNIGLVTGRLGYDLNQNLGVEVEAATGLAKDSVSVGFFPVDYEVESKVAAYLVGKWPISDQISLLGRAGYTVVKASVSNSYSQNDNFESFAAGVGAQYSFSERSAVRLDVTYLEQRQDSYDLAISFVRKF